MLWWAFLFIGDFLNHTPICCGSHGSNSYRKSKHEEGGNNSNNPCGSFLFYSSCHGKNSEFGLVGGLEFVLNLVWVKQTTSKFDFLVVVYGDLYIKNA